jgi:peptidoglycan/xylan/chitin deacetylase (PgdA/CDA1 family)
VASASFAPAVLCYHGVSRRCRHAFFVDPDALLRQVRLLLRLGFRPAAGDGLLDGRGRQLHVTFDDALAGLEPVLPALAELGVPVTIFACTDFVEAGRFVVPELRAEAERWPEEFAVLGWPELRRLAGEGVEIGSHSCSHPRLTRLAAPALARELRESRSRIEAETGSCRLLAYPYGDQDERVQRAARDAGYEAAFALPGRRRPLNPLALPRADLYRKHGLAAGTLKACVRAWL